MARVKVYDKTTQKWVHADKSFGQNGTDGYTPVKGVDYWTKADQQEIEAYIAMELAKRGQLAPEFATSKEECTDQTKMYVIDGEITSANSIVGGDHFNFFGVRPAMYFRCE